MGAGEYPCGFGPCGLDPLPTGSTPRSLSPPVALLFDGATRDFPLNPDTGRYYGVTPVAQKVELALLIALKALRAAPAVGISFEDVVPVEGDKFQADVEAAVRTALAPMLKADEIELISIVAASPVRGGIRAAVTFKDLTDPVAPAYTRYLSPPT